MSVGSSDRIDRAALRQIKLIVIPSRLEPRKRRRRARNLLFENMTDRLYYHDSFLYEFDAEVVDTPNGTAVVLDRTAFYPTSGGQIFDTGWISAGDKKFRVTEVADQDDGRIRHLVDAPIEKGTRVRGVIDIERRRDHMQQHSGQHVLSAAFVRLFNMPTVSFHMGDEACSIDLDTPQLKPE